MKKHAILFCCLLAGVLALNAQIPSLQSTQLFPEDLPYQMTGFRILGAQETDSSQELYFSFKHPNGGVESSIGAFSSFGKEPTTLEAFGKIIIKDDGTAQAAPVTWLGTPKLIGKSTYYARPLAGTQNMSQQPLASKDEIRNEDTLRQLRRQLSELPRPEAIKLEKTKAPSVDYVSEYFKTLIYVGLSGGLSQVATIKYTLKPEEDWDKGLDPKPYSDKLSINKKGVDAAFGDTKISYKGFYSSKIHDPLSGNALVLGGLKYKKDKTKENSHFFEFRLLVFNKEGELINSENFNSESPLTIESVQPIYGVQIAPETQEVTHAVYVLQGNGDRKMEGIERKLRRFLIVDIKTGEVLSNTTASLLQEKSTPFEVRQLANGALELGYYYPTEGEEGFTYLVIDKTGNINREEFGNNTYQLSGLTLPNDQFLRMKIETTTSFPLENGGNVELRSFKKETGSETSGDYRASLLESAFFVYDQAGKLLRIQKASGIGNIQTLQLLDRKNNIWKYYGTTGFGDSRTLYFKTLDLNTFEINSITPPENYSLAASNAYYQNKEQQLIYFLCRGEGKKGMYFFSYRY